MRHYLYRGAPFLVALALAGILAVDGPIWP